MEDVILTTDRLKLLQVTPAVMKEVFETYGDEQIKSFMGLRSDEELLKEKERYKKGLATFNRSFLYFYILNKHSGENMGWCGFHTWYVEHNRAEIGYGLQEVFRRNGFMSEAVAAVIDYGFCKMNLHRIEAFTSPANDASKRILRKLHFKQEGVLKGHYFTNNTMEDSFLFALLKHEYESTAR